MISMTPFLFVVLLAAVENAIIPTDDMDNRIFGGREASIEEFPSTASLFKTIYKNESVESGYWCGATILSERWVLTAAHCVEGAPVSNVTLRVGHENKNKGFRRHASRIIIHEEFINIKDENGNLIQSENDIAVVEVEYPFPLNDFTIKAARLPLQDEDIPPGIIVTAVGWGLTVENSPPADILQKANLQIMSTEVCKIHETMPIDRRNICVTDPREGKGTCRGDSGGPLFSNDVVIGVTSFGDVYCVRYASPNVFTNVAYFRDWIMQKTGI